MALLLSFDTATMHCAVALAEDGHLLACRAEERDRYSHAERLNVLIDEALKEAGRSLDHLAAIAVGIGPGSYTGLRIGLSAAKGLAFALDIPIIGMSTLEVLCHQLRASGLELLENDQFHPMVDARRMEVFTKTCDGACGSVEQSQGVVLDRSWVEGLDGTCRHVVFGDGADKAGPLWQHERIVHVKGVRPSVHGLVALAHIRYVRSEFADLAYLVPEYGKEAKVTLPK